jgi:hypothetical protein
MGRADPRPAGLMGNQDMHVNTAIGMHYNAPA